MSNVPFGVTYGSLLTKLLIPNWNWFRTTAKYMVVVTRIFRRLQQHATSNRIQAGPILINLGFQSSLPEENLLFFSNIPLRIF